jgi:hypothetical protein
MLLLDSSSIINVIAGTAGDLDVSAHFVDIVQSTNAVTVQAPVFTHITTAATVQVVGSPAAGTIRNIKNLIITNDSATITNVVEVDLYSNAYGSRLMKVTLLPNESIKLNDGGEWGYYAANGALQTPTQTPIVEYGIAGCLAETMPRNIIASVNTTALVSGTLFLQAIYLRAGMIVSNISFCSSSVAGATITNQIFGLYDGNRNLLASTANDGATAWATNTIKTLNIAAPYTVTQSGLYYLGIMVTATTVPTLAGNTALVSSALHGAAPSLHGLSTTTLTTALPNPASTITVGTTSVWGCVK